MPAGRIIQAAPPDAQRVWISVRLLPGSDPVSVGWDSTLLCTWPMEAGGDCCAAELGLSEREWWYNRHGGLQQQALYAQLQAAGGAAVLQVVELMYGQYLRDPCADQKEAEQFAVPAGAEAYYWRRCSKLTL